ncbi:MAG: hypothetical protein WAV51_03400 [Microgenomates group bacterium]
MNKFFLVIGFIILAVGAAVILRPNSIPTALTVPLPTEVSVPPIIEEVSSAKKTVEKFLQNISEKKITEAILMMTKSSVPDDATKQAWGVQFAAFTKLSVQKIEPSMQEAWTTMQETYQITMDVEMNEDSANGPIPYYGYDKGVNIRWISVEKEGSDWKIAGISTGP